jgi:glyoxylase-like metal-dependent hydrolase (beta-lactamase superfamily II)
MCASNAVKRLFVIPVGHIENDLMWNLAGVTAASRSEPNKPARWVRVPCLAYLIEHATKGWILYDTGFRAGDLDKLPDHVKEQFPADLDGEAELGPRLESIGLKPSDISQIVVSHMHWDHGGGLSLFGGLPAGQNVMAGEKDFSYGLMVTHRKSGEVFGGGGYFKHHFEVPGVSFNLIDPDVGDFDLAEDVRVLQFEGHTPQILGLLVDLPKTGPIVLPSDAVYMKRNLYPEITPPSIIYDSLGFLRSARKTKMLVEQTGARVIYPHDPEQMSGLKLLPEYYE